MSVEQATALIKKLGEDAEFRNALEAAPVERRRAILAEHGFGDVRLAHIAQALPGSAGGELSDEEFAAVAGGASFWSGSDDPLGPMDNSRVPSSAASAAVVP